MPDLHRVRVPAVSRYRVIAAAATAALLAACGQSQQGGGFHGFPPAEVTTVKVTPKTIPTSYEYVGQTTGSKEVEVRARVTGILERRSRIGPLARKACMNEPV